MNEHDSQDDRCDETISRDNDDVRLSIDAHASVCLDHVDDNPAGADDLASPAALEALDPSSARRVVDMQFLHVLLNELHHGTGELNSARVQRAMAAIHDEPSFIGHETVVARAVTATPASAGAETISADAFSNTSADQPPQSSRSVAARHNWFIPVAAIAATLSGVALWLIPHGTASGAYAAVQRVAADARILKDRQYRVTQTLRFYNGEQGQAESLLYVRGGQKHALRHRGPLGNVWMGSNGREGWLIPALGPPIITDNPRYPARWAREEGLALPDLQLTGLLDLMKERFHLALLPSEPLPDRPHIVCQRISGRCDVNDGGAKRIELWAHPDTGVAQRLVLEWDRSPEDAGLTAIQLDFLSEDPQLDDWYEVEAHRHPRPTLRRIPILPSAP